MNGEGGSDSNSDTSGRGGSGRGGGGNGGGGGGGCVPEGGVSDAGASEDIPPAIPTPAYLHLLYRLACLLEHKATQQRDKGQHLALVEAAETYARCRAGRKILLGNDSSPVLTFVLYTLTHYCVHHQYQLILLQKVSYYHLIHYYHLCMHAIIYVSPGVGLGGKYSLGIFMRTHCR